MYRHNSTTAPRLLISVRVFLVNRLSVLFSVEENTLNRLSGAITHTYATHAADLQSVADMLMICSMNIIRGLRSMFAILLNEMYSCKGEKKLFVRRRRHTKRGDTPDNPNAAVMTFQWHHGTHTRLCIVPLPCYSVEMGYSIVCVVCSPSGVAFTEMRSETLFMGRL